MNALAKVPSRTQRSHLALSQISGPTAELSLSGDFLLLVASWEERCLESLRAQHARYPYGAVVQFDEVGVSGRRENHDAVLKSGIAQLCEKPFDLHRKSIRDFFGWRDSLGAALVEARNRLGRPLALVIDATCLPKYYILLLLGFCFKAGLTRSITFFYAEGRYVPGGPKRPLLSDHRFTYGNWQALPVPFLEGELSADKRTRLIISVGFEMFQARQLIGSHEAERHVLIIPKPGFAPDYDRRGKSEVDALAAKLDLTRGDIFSCHAGDAACVMQQAIGLLDGSAHYKDVGLCLGTKPHAIGMGLAALLRPRFTLVCRVPDSYVESQTPATGTSWIYCATDLSAQPIH